ncbi:MAG: hypothetical protein O3A19_04245 [Planctomycetota bacterium]|nr:hypothetical protein [Planctomycetota bacterium]MDA1025617.1 hypothetical protein [Planctomycetota bacterium]
MPERSFGADEPQGPRRSGSRLVPRLCWLGAAAAIGGSLVWLVIGDNKGYAIFGGLVAIALSRVLLGDIARTHKDSDTEQRRSPQD